MVVSNLKEGKKEGRREGRKKGGGRKKRKNERGRDIIGEKTKNSSNKFILSNLY